MIGLIIKEVFTEDWVKQKVEALKKINKNIDPILLEKVTKAMYLLECLSVNGLPFVFKGGTSIILLIGEARRFSIDIDIIVNNGISVEKYLKEIIKNNYVFSRYEADARRVTGGLPVAHFKLYYHSIVDGRENYILLDVLYEEVPYSEVVELDIKNNLIDTIEPITKIASPSIDCILGDKLTAFAPNTTGIRYGQNKELEIIKQLYDIGCLFDNCKNINIVKDNFIRIAYNQINYRGLQNVTHIDVLNDIFLTSTIIAHRGNVEETKFKQLEDGVKRMRGYVLGDKPFIIEEAIGCAAKAAYLAMLLKSSQDKIERFDSKLDLKRYDVGNRLINTIKKFNPEGFYYWYKGLALKVSMESMAEVAPASETQFRLH